MSIQFPPNCGNSPKSKLLIAFNEAFMKGDVPAILEMVEDDIIWNLVGDKVINGKEAFEKELKIMAEYPIKSMEIFDVITHGKAAAINGQIAVADGKIYEFCNVYTFKSAGAKVIKKIKSFIIHQKGYE